MKPTKSNLKEENEKKERTKGRGCIYFDTSLKETRHGRHIYHNKWCAEITINKKRYRRRSKSYKVCEDFITEIMEKHGRV